MTVNNMKIIPAHLNMGNCLLLIMAPILLNQTAFTQDTKFIRIAKDKYHSHGILLFG